MPSPRSSNTTPIPAVQPHATVLYNATARSTRSLTHRTPSRRSTSPLGCSCRLATILRNSPPTTEVSWMGCGGGISRQIYSAQRQYFIENYAVLQIYFSSMQYLDITTNPGYSFMGLLSDIGGALGLLLGATLLTTARGFHVCLGDHLSQVRVEEEEINECRENIHPTADGAGIHRVRMSWSCLDSIL